MRHKAPHRGPVTTMQWRTTLSVETRYTAGAGSRLQLANLLLQMPVSKRILLLSQSPLQYCVDELRSLLESAGFLVHTLLLDASEDCKSASSLSTVWETLSENGFERKDTIVAIGGGALCDVAGFSAATYLRGINLVLVPSTLLAQVDAAIGGKTGINLKQGKNLVGAFYFPRMVLIDPEILTTLPGRELNSAKAEIIKYALIEKTVVENTEYRSGPRPLLSMLEQFLSEALAVDDPIWEGIILACVKMKLGVVGADPKEAGLRRCLNLGHTLGHAIETVSQYTVTHGEAVSMGMMFAFKLSESRSLIDSASVQRVRALIKRCSLPEILPATLSRDSLLEVMAKDKKREGAQIRFVLPVRELGSVDYDAALSLEYIGSMI
jgi:3-dehydroquinate synthase